MKGSVAQTETMASVVETCGLYRPQKNPITLLRMQDKAPLHLQLAFKGHTFLLLKHFTKLNGPAKRDTAAILCTKTL